MSIPYPNPIRLPVRKRTYNGSAFIWYHVQLPRERHERWLEAGSLIPHLCPPLTQREILWLVQKGPFCDNFNEALIFAINFSSQGSSDFPLRIAVRVTHNCIITVSWGRMPRLDFESLRIEGLLSPIPVLNEAYAGDDEEAGGDEQAGDNEVVGDNQCSEVGWSLLAGLTSVDDAVKPKQPVPNRIAVLLVHIVYSHVEHVQLAVSGLETELSSLELLWNSGDSKLKNEILGDGRCTTMHISLLRLIEIIDYGEDVFSEVREKCATKIWFSGEDAAAFGELMSRLRRLKARLGYIISRVTAVQAGRGSWLAKQTKRRLYCILFWWISFALFTVTGIFRMNVGGLAFSPQSSFKSARTRAAPAFFTFDQEFRNVILSCAGILSILLFCFGILSAIWFLKWKTRRALTRRQCPSENV